MVLLSLAAGGAAGSGLPGLYSYNRNSWMTDVQVNQNRRYQRQQVRLSQHEMFREDIRDLVQSSVTKLNNYVLIATLIMGMIAECYIEGPLPKGTAQFVVTLYMLCLGSSLLYIMLGVICAVVANHMASACQKDLLTTLVRLPVEEFVQEIEDAAQRESVEAFEHQQFQKMIRIPGFSRLRQQRRTRAKSCDSERRGRDSPCVASAERQAEEWEPGSQAECGERHLAVFAERERKWRHMGELSFLFGCLGMSHLLQAYGYFAMGKYYEGDNWPSFIVQLLIVLVDAALGGAYRQHSSFWTSALGAFINIVGPMAAALSIRIYIDTFDAVAVPLCISCHILSNLLGFGKLVALEKTGSAAALQAAGSEMDSAHEVSSFAEAACQCTASGESNGRAAVAVAGERSADPSAWKRRMVIAGSLAVVLAWVSTLGWVIFRLQVGQVDDGGHPELMDDSKDRRLSLAADCNLARELTFEELDVAWPSPHFQPHAAACGGGRCFIGSEFLVYELVQPAEGPRALTAAPCNVTAGIVDLAVSCSKKDCRLLALTPGPMDSPPVVVDCKTGQEQTLTKVRAPSAHLAAVHAGGSSALLTGLADRRVLQWQAAPNSWWPEWPVAEASAGLVGLDAAAKSGGEDDGRLLLMYSGHGDSASLEVLNLLTGERCQRWRLPAGSGALLGGSLLENEKQLAAPVLLLLASPGSRRVRLGRALVPELWAACSPLPQEVSASKFPSLRGVLHRTEQRSSS